MLTVDVVKRTVNTTTRGSRGRGHGRRIRGLFVRPDVRTTEASHVADSSQAGDVASSLDGESDLSVGRVL
jgi:hypothetical protein